MVGDRVATLDRYRGQGGVLVSIRCLDEGVDIPEISHAVIVASSRNPREFIQRRGRILRLHPGKTEAVIYDLLVLPPAADGEGDLDGLVLGELARAERFAGDARNTVAASKVKRWCIELGIDPDQLVDSGLEEDTLAHAPVRLTGDGGANSSLRPSAMREGSNASRQKRRRVNLAAVASERAIRRIMAEALELRAHKTTSRSSCMPYGVVCEDAVGLAKRRGVT